MNRVLLIIRTSLLALCILCVVTSSTSARSTLASPMPPPVRLQITLPNWDQIRSIEKTKFGIKSSLLLGYTNTLVVNVKKDGSASGSFNVFSRTSSGSVTTTGRFSFSGTYKNGKLSGTWVYNAKSEFPPTVDTYHLGPHFMDASGELITTIAIEPTGGKGYMSGELTWTHGECDKQDKDTSSPTFGACLERSVHTDVEDFSVDWKATPLCGPATIIACECKVQDSLARFNSLTGEVEVNCDVDEVDWEPAYMKMTLYVGDHIATRAHSSAILQLENMNTYIMKPNSEIVLLTPPEKETKLGLVLGRLWTNTRLLLLEGRMEIETTQAVAGIKGTTLVMETDGTTTTLKVIAGTVEFRSKNTGEMVVVNAGQQAQADNFGLLPVTAFDVQAEQASWATSADPALLKPSEGVDFIKKPVNGSTSTPDSEDSGIPSYVYYVCGGVLCVGGIVIAVVGVVILLRRRKKAVYRQ